MASTAMLDAAGNPLSEQTEKRGGSRGHPRLPFPSMRLSRGEDQVPPPRWMSGQASE